MGFRTADRIAQSMGTAVTDKGQPPALDFPCAAWDVAGASGHVFLPRDAARGGAGLPARRRRSELENELAGTGIKGELR